jgi:hypothetical protein
MLGEQLQPWRAVSAEAEQETTFHLHPGATSICGENRFNAMPGDSKAAITSTDVRRRKRTECSMLIPSGSMQLGRYVKKPGVNAPGMRSR